MPDEPLDLARIREVAARLRAGGLTTVADGVNLAHWLAAQAEALCGEVERLRREAAARNAHRYVARDRWTRKVLAYLASHGPQFPKAIIEATGVPRGSLFGYLRHGGWFENTQPGWVVTAAGRAALEADHAEP